MSTDAAATLTLRIDTGQAKADLELLKEKYGDLLAVMRAPATGKGVEGIGADAKLAAQQIDTLTKQVATLQAKMATAGASGSSGLLGNVTKAGYEVQGLFGQVDKSIERSNGNMKIMLRSAEMTGAASIKAGEAQIKNLDRLKAAQAAVYSELLRGDEQRARAQAGLRELNAAGTNASERARALAAEKQITQEMVAQAAARELNVTGARAAERARALAAEKQITQEMVAQAAARELNVTGARAAERARALAAEKQITKELEAQAKWLALTDKQRASATVQAAKAFYGGARQEQLPGVSGSSQALAAAQARGSVVAAEAAYKSLSTATKESAASQVHWNKVANEGHAAARGLAGGLGALWLTYGSLAPLLAGAAIAASMRQILSVGKELEFQFTMVSAISNGATVDIEKFNKAVAGTMFTPTEAAQGLRVLAQAGLEVDQALTALPSVLKLATVGETDMATAALSATSIMHAFGLSVNDMGHIGDVFAKAAAISATSVTAMMEAMKQASSVSDIFGVSMEETAASLATLANRGIEGSAAGTALRNMVKELAAPATDKAAAAMKQYGIEVFKADGSTKTLTENLQQLSEATSTMTDKSRTKFLEVLFNERGVKAANILLTDMQKMKVALDEIKMSSEGLGFMTEAQIKLSQSTEGMLKTLRSGFENTLADVFKGVAPQIKEIISALSDIAGSSEFKAFLTSTAQTVAYLTKTFLENIETVKLLGATYLAFKGISFAASAFNVLSVAVKEVTVGMRVLAAVDMTATAASMSAAAASGVQTTAALSAVASTGTKTGTVVANLAAGFSALLNPINLTIAGIGLVVVAGYNLYKMLTDVTSEQAKAIESANQYAKANEALAKSVDAGARALSNELGILDEQIKLLRQGKAAADAYAQAKANAPVREAEANLAAVEAKLKTATDRVNAGPVGGGDATAESNEQRQNIRAMEAIAREYQDVYKTTSEIRKQTGKALDDSKELASKRATVDAITTNRNLNDQLADFKAKGDAAAAALKAQTYANGVSKEAADRARERLQKQVDLRDKTEGIRSKPLSDDATQAEREARKAQIDSLLDNSFEPKGRTKPGGGGSSRAAVKDERSILNAKMESALRQEKIQLGTRLIEIETQLADQTISATVATQRKNEATMASLEAEGLLLEKSMKAAQAVKDKVQIEKVQGQIDENKLKLLRQTEQATLDNTKANTANRNSIQDLTTISSRYIEDLQFEQIALDKTAQEVAQLRIEREQLRAVEDLQRRVDRNQVDPEVAKAERGAIDAKAAAQMQDQEFQRSYVAGWKKAHKAYVDDATNAAKQAADSYQAMSSAIEGALDEFLTTGKLNFAKFAQSVILDIAKIEAKALAAKAMSSIGGGEGGFGGIVNGILGMFGGGGGGFSSGDFANLAASFIDSAKGNVFSGSPSLHAYANTVQTSPKTFAFQNLHGFAKGGIFAEAGPEAVMPLKRDSYGRLGVQAEGGTDSKVINITVNVNGTNAPDVRRAAGQGAREALSALNGARRYG